jgi:hypothetical protein
MKKALIAFIVLVVIALIILVNTDLEYEFSKSLQIPKLNQNTLHSFNASPTDKELVLEHLSVETKNELEQFKRTFYKEVEELGQIQSNPNQVQEHLNTLGKGLSSIQIKYLDELLYNTKTNDDAKAIAIELLANSQSQGSLNILKKFVLENLTPSHPSHIGMNSILALKLQALEGISNYNDVKASIAILTEIHNKTTEKLILDRAIRAYQSLQGTAPPLEVQEKKALLDVLKNSL